MTRGVPMIDPKVHLKSATPEKLVRALFRRTSPVPVPAGKPVAGDQVPVEKVPADETGDGVTHLVDGV